jgi:cell division septation protein DedD
MAPNKPNDGIAKLVRAEDAKKAMAEYQKAAAAVDANTLRLRALRLEREAAEALNKPAAPAKGKGAKGTASKKGKTKAAPTGSLSDWLKDREGSGRNN